MDDGIEVEVVCPKHQRDRTYLSSDCVVCGGNAGANSTPRDRGTVEAILVPGSLVALKVALADAVDAVRANMAVMQRRVSAGEDCSVDREYLDAFQREFGLEDAEESALDALRAHPDYTEPTNG